MPTVELREVLGARAFADRSPPEARRLAQEVVRRGGEDVRAVIFFGSRRTGARPGVGSAYDFFVVTAAYAGFYRSLHASGALRRPASLVAALNVPMPPNQISITLPDPPQPPLQAKCAVVSLRAFLRETSPSRRDHFFLGRLFQPTEVLYVADEATRVSILDALERAHRLTYSWVRPWLPPRFDTEAYCRSLFKVSYSAEIRPEPAGRIETLWQAQQGELQGVYATLLEDLAAGGALVGEGEGLFSLRTPPSRWERLRLALHFRWSAVRATARWAKYMVTFDDWLDFILRKAERHSGTAIVLTPRERRLPLIFLWPRFFRYLRGKDKPR